MNSYTVRSGDTMWKIAQRQGMSLAALARANPQVKDPAVIDIGDQLKLPGSSDGFDGPGPTTPTAGPTPALRDGATSFKVGPVTVKSNDPNYGPAQVRTDLRRLMKHEYAQGKLGKLEERTVAAILDSAYRYYPDLPAKQASRLIIADIQAESDFDPKTSGPGSSGPAYGLMQVTPGAKSGEVNFWQKHAKLDGLVDWKSGRPMSEVAAGKITRTELQDPWINIHMATWLQSNFARTGGADPDRWGKRDGTKSRTLETAFGSWVAGPAEYGGYGTRHDNLSGPYLKRIGNSMDFLGESRDLGRYKVKPGLIAFKSGRGETENPPKPGPLPRGGVRLDAKGMTGNAARDIQRVFGPGTIEAPSSRNITEVDDPQVGKAFEFKLNRDKDGDPTGHDDRQRCEVKLWGKSPKHLLGTRGTQFQYKWRFKLEDDLAVSKSFSHFFQLKGVGGKDDGHPLLTLTGAKRGDSDKLEVRFRGKGDSDEILDSAPLSAARGKWVEVTVDADYAKQGSLKLDLKTLDGKSLLHVDRKGLDTMRDFDFVRPKWGIYRSLKDKSQLAPGDTRVRFADFSIIPGQQRTRLAEARALTADGAGLDSFDRGLAS